MSQMQPGWYPHQTIPGAEIHWNGTAWTETRKVPTAAPDQPRRVDPTYAWTLAVLPLASLALTYFLPGLNFTLVAVGFLAVNVLLIVLDGKRIRQDTGTEPMSAISAILVPIYLIWRTTKLKSTPAIPVVWFLAFGASIVGSLTFAAAYEFDTVVVEQEIASWLGETQNAPGASVACPEIVGKAGDTFTCTATDSTGSAPVVVTVADDGSITWALG